VRIISCDTCGNRQDNENNLYLSHLLDERSWLIVEAVDPSDGEMYEYQLCSYLCLSMWAATMMEESGNERPQGLEGTSNA
jgi:hypothetical protein